MSDNLQPSILQVLPELNIGGIERGVVDLAIKMKEHNIRLIVASKGGKLVEKLEENGIEHFTLDLKSKNPLKIIANIAELKKLAQNQNVKIIHARSRAPAWSAYFAAKSLKTPFITSFHGFYRFNFPLKKAYNNVMTLGDTVIAVSEFIKKHIIKNYKIDESKITVVHRGVDVDEFNPDLVSEAEVIEFKKQHRISDDKKIILLPGRITRWKGHDVLVKAIKLVDRDNFILAFAGNSGKNEDFLNEVKQLIIEKNLQKKVSFLGAINNMPLAYKAADIVVSSSVEPETFGRVSAEAGAMGRFVVATNHGGSTEIIDDGVTGFLTEISNEKDIAQKLVKALDKVENNNVFLECRERICEHFSLNKMCDSNIKIYNKYYPFT